MKYLQHDRSLKRAVPLCVLLGISVLSAACASRDTDRSFGKSEAGQIIGGVAGAAAGSQIGDGSGRTAAMIAGALLGSVVGERIGARMERDDLRQTALVLEDNRSGQSTAWVNPDTGNRFSVTPTKTYERDGQPCRQFDFRVATSRGSDLQERTACRRDNGTWEVVS
jgi:surface antigen